MLPLDWLRLANKSLTEVADELAMKLVTVSRHFRGIRYPGPDLVKRYEEYTKGAVKAEDWLMLWEDQEAAALRAKEDVVRRQWKKKREAA